MNAFFLILHFIDRFPGYHRTVLVLVHDDEANLRFSDARISYAFEKLVRLDAEHSRFQSAEMKPWVDRIVSNRARLDKRQAFKMLEIAMKWKDLEMFKTIMKLPVCTVKMDVLSEAWKIFSFEEVRSR